MTRAYTPLKLVGVAVSLSAVAVGLTACEPPQSPPAMTIAMTATSADPQSTIDQVVRDRLVEHASNSLYPGDGKVSIVVQGKAGVAETVDLTPMRNKDVEADPDKAAEMIAEKLPRLAQKVSGLHASTDGQDVIGVLDNAIQITPSGGTIVLAASGLSTTSPIDLRQAGEWLLNPEEFAEAIDKDDIPSAVGRHIVFAGIGYPAPNSKQPAPATAARTALKRLWLTVCHRTMAASCTILDGPAGTDDSTSTNQVPVVGLDQVTTRCVGSKSVSGDVAFEPDSAVLTRAADKILAPIARSLSNCPTGRVVNALGHAAEVPGGGDGQELSEARAIAVLQRLRDLGAPSQMIGSATGVGSTRDQIVDNTPGNPGVYVEKLARLNRVVELHVTATITEK